MPDENTTKIFIAYSREDSDILDKLRTNLKVLERTQNVQVWYDGEIEIGTDWAKTIKTNLHSADIILLLISENFIASDYCYDNEMTQALSLHDTGKVKAIPIIAKECLWQETPFARLQALPADGKPLTSNNWSNPNQPYFEVVKELKNVIGKIQNKNQIITPVEPQPIITEKRTTINKTISANKVAGPSSENTFLEILKKWWRKGGILALFFISIIFIPKLFNGGDKKKDTVSNATTVLDPKYISPTKTKYGKFTDTRDGMTYKTIIMDDGKTWMAENLNYNGVKSYCYNNSELKCNKNGRLYPWTAAKNACPKGWNLPTRREWNSLIKKYGGKKESLSNLQKNKFGIALSGFRNEEGAFVGWDNGTNDFASFWSATEIDTQESWGVVAGKELGGMYTSGGERIEAMSCRCVLD